MQIRYRQGDIYHRRWLGYVETDGGGHERRNSRRDAKVHKVSSVREVAEKMVDTDVSTATAVISP